MTSLLVQRCRIEAKWEQSPAGNLLDEAADRIELLEIALRTIAGTTDNQYYFWCQAVANRALENKE